MRASACRLLGVALIVLAIGCAESLPRSQTERACARTSDPELCETEYADFVANGESVALCLSPATGSWYFIESRPGLRVGDPCGEAGGFEIIAISD